MGFIRISAVSAATLATCLLAGASLAQPPAIPAAAPPAGVMVATPAYASVHMEVDVNKSATEAWARVGKFCDLGEWLRAPCVITSGADGQLGAVRTIAGRIIEVLVGKGPTSYSYTQPVGSNTAPYNLYHGTLQAIAVTPTTSKLTYDIFQDNSMIPEANREATMTRLRTQFQGALASMKILAEGGTMPAAPARGGAPGGGRGGAPAGAAPPAGRGG
jgi:hypothetical protein